MDKKTLNLTAMNVIAQALKNVKGNTDLVNTAAPAVTETTDQLAVLVVAEKMAAKILSKVEKKATKLSAKPTKVRKARTPKATTEAPVTTETVETAEVAATTEA